MIITISNQKGGVGKTTTAANLAVQLARQHRRVLLIQRSAVRAHRQLGDEERVRRKLATQRATLRIHQARLRPGSELLSGESIWQELRARGATIATVPFSGRAGHDRPGWKGLS